ncbi:general stress protein [Carnobacterium mobile]|uniref:general stress protein n=1 Tax=Carnobacterium mobile TaxID=2750 RepID=UPI001866802E|nr:general stress protein [Carnobacterium mobile]
MDRRVEGTYTSTDEAVKAVERLLNEGYVADEILIITDNNHENELEDLTLVDVEAVETEEEESLWDKIKDTFNFGNYNEGNDANPLVEYGIDAEAAEHFNEALENRETIILLDSTAPANIEHLSTVNEEVLNGEGMEETEMAPNNENKNNSENVEPSEVETKEAMKPESGEEEQFDPSKAQSAREDVAGTSVASSPDKGKRQDEAGEPIDKHKNSVEGLPQLTGDEQTVETDESNHVYPDNISKGVVGEDTAKNSPLNAEPRQEEHPDAHKNIPESDAYYGDKYEDAGGKTIKDDEKK